MGFIKSFFGFIYDMLDTMFRGGWVGIILGIFMVAVIVCLALAVPYGIFVAIDSWFLPREQAPGVINGKHYSPAYWMMMTTSVPNGSGGVTTTTYPVRMPPTWRVSVMVSDRQGSMSCSQKYHDSVQHGTKVTAHYVDGRMTGNMYIKSLSAA